VLVNRHWACPRERPPGNSAPARESTCENLISRQLDAKPVLLAALKFSFEYAVLLEEDPEPKTDAVHVHATCVSGAVLSE
jgi:hypothetical protein